MILHQDPTVARAPRIETDPRLRPCSDCNGAQDIYMVHNDVWSLACHADREAPRLLCFACLEQRLRRRLTIDAFPPVRGNRMIVAGYRGAGGYAPLLPPSGDCGLACLRRWRPVHTDLWGLTATVAGVQHCLECAEYRLGRPPRLGELPFTPGCVFGAAMADNHAVRDSRGNVPRGTPPR